MPDMQEQRRGQGQGSAVEVKARAQCRKPARQAYHATGKMEASVLTEEVARSEIRAVGWQEVDGQKT